MKCELVLRGPGRGPCEDSGTHAPRCLRTVRPQGPSSGSSDEKKGGGPVPILILVYPEGNSSVPCGHVGSNSLPTSPGLLTSPALSHTDPFLLPAASLPARPQVCPAILICCPPAPFLPPPAPRLQAYWSLPTFFKLLTLVLQLWDSTLVVLKSDLNVYIYIYSFDCFMNLVTSEEKVPVLKDTGDSF